MVLFIVMKKNVLVFGLFGLVIFNSCGPAAENRETMHIRAKAFQDSIAFIIKSSIAESEAPAPGQVVIPDTSKKIITQGTPTVK